jgi:peptidoglycan biosynthesis protein MviN/MurJ (putative lipid II flippase)
MSAGLPVVSYDTVAGPSDIITDQVNGFLVSVFNDELFLERLQKLVDDEELRSKLGMAALVVLAIHITCKTWIVTLIWIGSSIVNIALNVWLIPLYGRMGAAYVTMFSVLFMLVMYILAAQKVFPLIVSFFSIIKIVLFLVLFNYAGSLINFGLFYNILIKTTLVGVYLLSMIYLAGVIRKNELLRFKSFMRSRSLLESSKQ